MKTAMALGTFDGVHLGHKEVIKAACSKENAVVLAFSIPPKVYFGNTDIILTDTKRKEALIKELGAKRVDFLDFSKVKNVSANEFFKFIVENYNPEYIFCGENYTFGKSALGNVELLKKLCKGNNIKLTVCDSVKYNNQAVSSTVIREFLKKGELKTANELLGSDYSFSASVIHGDKRGRTIGFPTVNQLYPQNAAALKKGVYKSEALVDGKLYKAISNIGVRPTYRSRDIICETYILDFSKDIYNKNVRIFLKEFLREEQRFSSIDELKNAIKDDLKKAQYLL